MLKTLNLNKSKKAQVAFATLTLIAKFFFDQTAYSSFIQRRYVQYYKPMCPKQTTLAHTTDTHTRYYKQLVLQTIKLG